MKGSKAPVKRMKKISRGGSILSPGHGKMKFNKAERKAAKRELDKERYAK